MQLQFKQKINIRFEEVYFSEVFNVKLGSVRFCCVSFLSMNKI